MVLWIEIVFALSTRWMGQISKSSGAFRVIDNRAQKRHQNCVELWFYAISFHHS